MKINHLNDITKIMILIATILVVCVLCAVGFKITNSGKAGVNQATNQMNDMSSDYVAIDIALYDGSIILGSELMNLIQKAVDKKQYLSIEVMTLDKSTRGYNYIFNRDDLSMTQEDAQTEVPDHKSQSAYINTMAKFIGETYKDSKGNIVCIRFEQQQ